MKRNQIATSIFWKTAERFGYHGVKLLVQIILARILSPEHFGTLSIVLSFINLATVFVESGLNTALIQKKDADEIDYSTVFFLTGGLAIVLYIIIFFIAPIVAEYYSDMAITAYLRIVGLSLLGGAINSIQIAYSSSRFDFKAQFWGNCVAAVVSSGISIIMACKGAGVWALIIQQLVWQFTSVLIMWFAIKWRPICKFSFSRAKELFSFGWKMLASSLLIKFNSIFGSLVIGKRFSAESLGYYSKASTFPTTFSDVVVNAVSSVVLVSISKEQNDKEKAKQRVIKFVKYSYLFIAPIMVGLACISEPLISFLLTDKWLPAVPYLRLFCLFYFFQPLCSIYGQAVSGMGRSDSYLKVYAIIKPIGLLFILLTGYFTDHAIYMTLTVDLVMILETLLQMKNVKQMFDLSYRHQLSLWVPSLLNALIMAIPVILCGMMEMPLAVSLITQCLVGLTSYLIIALITKQINYHGLLKLFAFINNGKE